MQPRQRDTEAVVFTWRQNVKLRKYRQVLPGGVTQVIIHPSEESMLLGWLAWLQTADPDILNVFQASMRSSVCQESGHVCLDVPKRKEDFDYQAKVQLHVKPKALLDLDNDGKGFNPSYENFYVCPYTGQCLLQVRDTLGALADRCAALKIDGAALHVSRLLRRESRGLAVKRITMYSPNWVKSQNRMSSTSNQACRLAVTMPKHFSRPWLS